MLWLTFALPQLTQLLWLTSSVAMWGSGTEFFLTLFTQSSSLHSHLLRNQQGVEAAAL